MDSNGVLSSEDERRLMGTLKSSLNWMTQRNFEQIKNEIVQTIKAYPSILKSLVCYIFDKAMVDNAYVLFSRLCVDLFRVGESHGSITTFERLFLAKCRFELENSYPLEDVEECSCWKFVKIVRILAQVFKNKMVNDTTRQNIIQVLINPIFAPKRNIDAMYMFLSLGKLTDFQCSSKATEMERKYNEEVKLRKESEHALAREIEELEMLKRLLESYKEEQGKLQLQNLTLEKNHQEGLRVRKETEYALAIEREKIEKARLVLQNLSDEVDIVCLKNEELESMYKGEVILRKETENALAIEREKMEEARLVLQNLSDEIDSVCLKNEELERMYNREAILLKESETALEKERKELEEMKKQLETCKTEQESLTTQFRTWQEKYNEESILWKETDGALSRNKQELVSVNRLLECYTREADSMREERDNAFKLVQELKMKQSEERELPSSFYCPITQEVMKDPQMTSDGYSYEAKAIKEWFKKGQKTSPMTNLKILHCKLVPNRTLRSAIQEFV